MREWKGTRGGSWLSCCCMYVDEEGLVWKSFERMKLKLFFSSSGGSTCVCVVLVQVHLL